jgi:hypothetical protein
MGPKVEQTYNSDNNHDELNCILIRSTKINKNISRLINSLSHSATTCRLVHANKMNETYEIA